MMALAAMIQLTLWGRHFSHSVWSAGGENKR